MVDITMRVATSNYYFVHPYVWTSFRHQSSMKVCKLTDFLSLLGAIE